jgi:CheY-like chemotaxis protein
MGLEGMPAIDGAEQQKPSLAAVLTADCPYLRSSDNGGRLLQTRIHERIGCFDIAHLSLRAPPIRVGRRRCLVATTQTTGQAQRSSPATTLLVVERDDDIRRVLVYLLEDEGYAVLEAEELRTAEPLMDAVSTPLVLLIGDAEVADYGRLEFFTAVAANPATNRAYIYLSSTPTRWRLPALVQVLKVLKIPTVDKPFEVVSLLSIVATAAEQAHS